MKLYIAGPMTGVPELNHPAFEQAVHDLKTAGYQVESPHWNENPDPQDYRTWMKLGFRQLLFCDGVAVLPGHESSSGASHEVWLANYLHMPVKQINAWLDEADEEY